MNANQLSDLVGKSFEDLSVEEMQLLQGAGTAEPDSTPSVVAISSVEVSQAISTLVSIVSASVVSIVASKAGKCGGKDK